MQRRLASANDPAPLKAGSDQAIDATPRSPAASSGQSLNGFGKTTVVRSGSSGHYPHHLDPLPHPVTASLRLSTRDDR